MKQIAILLFTIFIYSKSNSQLIKGSWVLGGDANFSLMSSSKSALQQFKQTDIQIRPAVGYFLMDKFSVGLNPSYTYVSNNAGNSYTILGIGPFTRYYFLSAERAVNLFAEGSYSYGFNYGKRQDPSSRSNTFSIAGGPVVYFNSSVGLEFTLGYSATKFVGYSGTNGEVRFGVGFHFYLESDN